MCSLFNVQGVHFMLLWSPLKLLGWVTLAVCYVQHHRQSVVQHWVFLCCEGNITLLNKLNNNPSNLPAVVSVHNLHAWTNCKLFDIRVRQLWDITTRALSIQFCDDDRFLMWTQHLQSPTARAGGGSRWSTNSMQSMPAVFFISSKCGVSGRGFATTTNNLKHSFAVSGLCVRIKTNGCKHDSISFLYHCHHLEIQIHRRNPPCHHHHHHQGWWSPSSRICRHRGGIGLLDCQH